MFLFDLAIIMLASTITSYLCKKFNQVTIVGYFIVGILLGPSFWGILSDSTSLDSLSQLGAMIIVFIAGLETNKNKLMNNLGNSTFIGITGTLFSFLAGYLTTSILLNFSQVEAIFLGTLFSATSVGITVRSLKEINQLNTHEGIVIVGATVIDDIATLIALPFLQTSNIPQITQWFNLITQILFILVTSYLGFFGFRWLQSKIPTSVSNDVILSLGLFICLIFSFLAEVVGLTAILGAFIAGITIGDTTFKQKILQKTELIGSFFIPVFFVTFGSKALFDDINFLWFIIISLSAILSKLVSATIASKMVGFSMKSSLGIGSAMISRGIVTMIVAYIGIDQGILTQEVFTLIVATILLTNIISPPLTKYFLTK